MYENGQGFYICELCEEVGLDKQEVCIFDEQKEKISVSLFIFELLSVL